MVKKWLGLVLLLVFIGLSLGFIASRFSERQPQETEPSSGASAAASPTPDLNPACTRYTNEGYGFSVCYPLQWRLPEEGKVAPPQQHLYQIILDPGGEEYLIDIYNQPAPVSLGSFVRDYFKDVEAGVSWTNDLEIGGQKALQFFIPKMGARAVGIGAVAFRKEGYILTLSTPAKRVPEGDLKQLVNEATLTQLARSFEWVD